MHHRIRNGHRCLGQRRRAVDGFWLSKRKMDVLLLNSTDETIGFRGLASSVAGRELEDEVHEIQALDVGAGSRPGSIYFDAAELADLFDAEAALDAAEPPSSYESHQSSTPPAAIVDVRCNDRRRLPRRVADSVHRPEMAGWVWKRGLRCMTYILWNVARGLGRRALGHVWPWCLYGLGACMALYHVWPWACMASGPMTSERVWPRGVYGLGACMAYERVWPWGPWPHGSMTSRAHGLMAHGLTG